MLLFNARVILPDRIDPTLAVLVRGDRIEAIAPLRSFDGLDVERIDLGGAYLSPGFVEVHTHGAMGYDFMDGSIEAFDAIRREFARHGTTSMTPTSTVAEPDYIHRFLRECSAAVGREIDGSRVMGAHLYGPWFRPEAKGCHPGQGLRDATEEQVKPYLEYAADIRSVTVAPELDGAESATRTWLDAGVSVNIGHSWASFAQVERAIGWGATHVDHLFCAMSDRALMKWTQPFPMRGGVLEATLHFDELTTEVIADGTHLDDSLLRLAWKIKGPERLTLVSDTSGGMGMPDGLYHFGPKEYGVLVRKRGDSGLTPDASGLASGVVGLDRGLQVMARATGAPLHDIIRAMTLTPARMMGRSDAIGSIEVGKYADLIVLDESLNVVRTIVGGRTVFSV